LIRNNLRRSQLQNLIWLCTCCNYFQNERCTSKLSSDFIYYRTIYLYCVVTFKARKCLHPFYSSSNWIKSNPRDICYSWRLGCYYHLICDVILIAVNWIFSKICDSYWTYWRTNIIKLIIRGSSCYCYYILSTLTC